MNNMRYLPILYLLFNLPFLSGAVGCMDNSRHLKERFDSKEYAYVECDCGCTKLLPDGKTCFSCGHVRLPSRWEILSDAAQKAKKSAKTSSSDIIDSFITPGAVMKQLIDLHRKIH